VPVFRIVNRKLFYASFEAYTGLHNALMANFPFTSELGGPRDGYGAYGVRLRSGEGGRLSRR
jgi:hypothetical protein